MTYVQEFDSWGVEEEEDKEQGQRQIQRVIFSKWLAAI